MADKTVVLINPNGEKISFTCPFKLMEFLDHVYYKQYIDHGALPYEWKWEWYQTYWKTIKYYEYKILVNCATNTYEIWDCELDRCVYESVSVEKFDTFEDAIKDAKSNIDECKQIQKEGI